MWWVHVWGKNMTFMYYIIISNITPCEDYMQWLFYSFFSTKCCVHWPCTQSKQIYALQSLSVCFSLPLVVRTSTWKPITAAGSTAKAAGSPRRSSASQRPPLWPLMAMASTGPRRGGRPLPRVTLQLRASRPQQAQLAPTSSRSLLCDSLADGCDSAQQEERKEEEEEEEERRRRRWSRLHYLYGRTVYRLTGSTGRALFSRGVTSWCFREDRWCGDITEVEDCRYVNRESRARHVVYAL